MFAFASNLDALTHIDKYKKTIDEDSFLLFLALTYIPAPKSIYKNLKKLQPGHWLKIENNKLSIQKYWDVTNNYQKIEISNDDFVREAFNLLNNSIRLNSHSDVPIGCFLSGGIDSSIISALYCRENDEILNTFTVDLEGKNVTELSYAKLVSDLYNTNHVSSIISSKDAMQSLYELIPLMDEPMSDSAIVPTYYISKKANQQGIKVILSGAGGDELFGGYKRHYVKDKSILNNSLPLIPDVVWIYLGKILGHNFVHSAIKSANKSINFGLDISCIHLGYLHSIFIQNDSFIRLLDLWKEQLDEIIFSNECMGSSYSKMITDVKHYLPGNILTILDKISMATSLEGRVPFLDHRLVELVFSVKQSTNIASDFNHSKASLKKLSEPFLPKQILKRRKIGFNGPVYYWLNSEYKFTVFERLKHTKNPILLNLINLKNLEKIFNNSNQYHQAIETIFMLFVFDIWYDTHFN